MLPLCSVLPSILFLVLLFHQVLGQATWCGKNYRVDQPEAQPGGAYPVPEESPANEPLLLFRCTPKFRPFIHGDDTKAILLVDLAITHTKMNGTGPLFSSSASIGNQNEELGDPKFLVTISADHIPLLGAQVMGLGLRQKLAFPLLNIIPRKHAYNLTCKARKLSVDSWKTANNLHSPFRQATTHAILLYQPPNPNGSMVKIDSETRGMLVRGGGPHWRPIFPYGFYTAFDDYLAKNLSAIDEAVNQWHNLIHPVPSFGNLTALEVVLDKMEEQGIWLMYDMRWSYKNITTLTDEINRVKNRKNLLLWYTADEWRGRSRLHLHWPDGWGDNPDDAKRAYELINELDGYHPVSLVLNCQDYYFREYTTGTADILLQDTYPVGINASHSTVYDTPCTPTFGDCGCDNCSGNGILDVAERLDRIHERLEWEGRTGVPVWSVVQAFGNQSFWARPPTDREFIAQIFTSLIHGARGLVPWIAPTTEGIFSATSLLRWPLYLITSQILNPDAVHTGPNTLGVTHLGMSDPSPVDIFRLVGQIPLVNSDETLCGPILAASVPPNSTLQTGLWCFYSERLMVLASNIGNQNVSFRLKLSRKDANLAEVLNVGARTTVTTEEDTGEIWAEIALEKLGSIAFFVF